MRGTWGTGIDILIDMIKFACYLNLVWHEKPELMLRVRFSTSSWDDADRDSFVNRLGKVLIETHTDCFAWAMLSNSIGGIVAMAIFFRIDTSQFFASRTLIYWSWYVTFI